MTRCVVYQLVQIMKISFNRMCIMTFVNNELILVPLNSFNKLLLLQLFGMLEDYLQGFIQQKQFKINSPTKTNYQKEQLLLSNERHSFTSLSENEQSILNLLIAPYHQIKSAKHMINISEDNTILNGSSTLKIKARDDDIIRLKQIIDNKNHIIGQLTEEMKEMTDKIVLLCKHGTHTLQQLNQNKEDHGSSHKRKQHFKPESRISYQKNIQFLQNNNHELYKELKQCQKERQYLQELLKQKQLKTNQLEQQINKLNKENQQLKRVNFNLNQNTKQFLNDSQKQIQIFSQMRSIIAQKISLKEKQERKAMKNHARLNKHDENCKSAYKKHKQRQIQTTLTKKMTMMDENESFMSNSLMKKSNKEKVHRYNECSSFSKSMSKLGK